MESPTPTKADARTQAIEAMRQRGVDNPDTLTEHANPDAILGACQWFDRQGNGAGVGLLVWKIRQGGVPVRTIEEPQAKRPPVWLMPSQPIFYQSHAGWDERRGYHPECAGRLMVVEAFYPVATIECDQCGLLAGLSANAMPAGIKQQLAGDAHHNEGAAP